MIDCAIAVYDASGFHHCPPGRCIGRPVTQITTPKGKKEISQDALIFRAGSNNNTKPVSG